MVRRFFQLLYAILSGVLELFIATLVFGLWLLAAGSNPDAVLVVGAFLILWLVDFLGRINQEAFGRKIISWWPTLGYERPLAVKLLYVFAMSAIVGFVIYKTVTEPSLL
jgi:hypothetical protein